MTRRSLYALLLSALVIFGAAVLFACSQTPTSVPLRTFERAQRIDVVCLRLFGPTADPNLLSPIIPEPRPEEECVPVPADTTGGGLLDKQLFGIVTQSSRGEIAVVDLSAGVIIDQQRAIPGTNFIPVGALPTDVAVTPDGKMIFVAAAEPNKAAIYGVPSHRILGDLAGRPADPDGVANLASWPVCELPQNPGSITIVPRRAVPGAHAGAAPGAAPYEIVVVLPGDHRSTGKVVTIDPLPFLRGAPRKDATGKVVDDWGSGPVLAPGSLAPCPITAAVELAGDSVVPTSYPRGPAWDDGVKYQDGGVDLLCDRPRRATRCGDVPCKCVADAGAPDAATDGGDGGVPEAVTCDPTNGETDAGLPLKLGPLDPPRLVASARDDQTLYVADEGAPLIHVIDLSVPGSPHELQPLLAAASGDPTRIVAISALAVSPPTRDYKRYLYAVDQKDGSLIVYDVTDPLTMPHVPLVRPHAELNPFQAPDRISFASPAVTVAFARHDFPLGKINGVAVPSSKSGLLCNPNPNLDLAAVGAPNGQSPDLGFYYRAGSADPSDIPLGPSRLRGIFAFVTLANGQVVTIDVDDWDAPCRRPNDMTPTSPFLSAIAPPEPPPTSTTDFDAYRAPTAAPLAATNELFFPVSQPHRIRSGFYLRDDPATGRHIPYLASIPSVDVNGTPLALFGEGSDETPRMHPTTAGDGDPGISFAVEIPEVHIDQDWAVVYEGVIPGFDGISATVSTPDNYSSLTLTQPQGRFCTKGIEDWTVGGERATAMIGALAAASQPLPTERIDRRMVDYVQVSDEILDETDPYWLISKDPSQSEDPAACFDGLAPGHDRWDMCQKTYGTFDQQNAERDFPILEAYEDHLVIGRYYAPSGQTREIVYKDPSNAAALRRMRCCFHNQVNFHVRTGGEWVTLGSAVGLLNHVERGDGGRCVLSCDPQKALLESRAPALPYTAPPLTFLPGRNSPLAMRNPAFSFFMGNGTRKGADLVPTRDTTWRFSSRGQFTPLVINIAATTTAVNPQSMKFVEALGQMAIVDGASEGLILLNLEAVAIARDPYF